MKILYEDRDLIVCQKLAGVLSQPAAGRSGEDMIARLAAHFADQDERATPHVVHRLDRATAGVMVYAKNSRAAAALSAAAQGEGMKKTYLAVVEGVPTPPSGEMTDLLFFDRAKDKTYVVDRLRRGVKEARLSYITEKTVTIDDAPFSLVRITLDTGRTHQIRAQFAARRMPLYGDARYGAKTRGSLGLFATALTFPHPKDGKSMTFSLEPEATPFALFE